MLTNTFYLYVYVSTLFCVYFVEVGCHLMSVCRLYGRSCDVTSFHMLGFHYLLCYVFPQVLSSLFENGNILRINFEIVGFIEL